MEASSEISLGPVVKVAPKSSVGMVCIHDKATNKPLWVSLRYQEYLNAIEEAVMSSTDSNSSRARKEYAAEKRLLLEGLYKYLAPLMKDQVRKKSQHKTLQKLASNRDGQNA